MKPSAMARIIQAPGDTPARKRPCVSVLALLISFPPGLGSSTATVAPTSGVPRSSLTVPVTKASAGEASTARPPEVDVLNELGASAPSKQPAIRTLIALFIILPPFGNDQRLQRINTLAPSAGASFFRDSFRTSVIENIVEISKITRK